MQLMKPEPYKTKPKPATRQKKRRRKRYKKVKKSKTMIPMDTYNTNFATIPAAELSPSPVAEMPEIRPLVSTYDSDDENDNNAEDIDDEKRHVE